MLASVKLFGGIKGESRKEVSLHQRMNLVHISFFFAELFVYKI